ncbi:MAG: NERD domain-containing protein [Oscillospiraceae bacterium]|nr:NERD domain-containing protein [Oscillospiraceae bacterium]
MKKGLLDIVSDKLADAIWNGLHMDDKVNDPNFKGKLGEDLTGLALQISKLLGIKGRILKDLYLPTDDGETTEIDLLFITDMGLLVIESKNYSGWIFGNEKDRYWTASLPNGVKNRFFSPVLQNKGHISALRALLAEDIPIWSVIVFSHRCELKKITVTSDDLYVVKRDDILTVIGDIKKKGTRGRLDKQNIDDIYSALSVYADADDATKQRHIERIETKYGTDKKAATQEETMPDIQPELPKEDDILIPTKETGDITSQDMICPRCGSTLVLRTAKRGENVGKQFYGCSAFPRCRYTKTDMTDTYAAHGDS